MPLIQHSRRIYSSFDESFDKGSRGDGASRWKRLLSGNGFHLHCEAFDCINGVEMLFPFLVNVHLRVMCGNFYPKPLDLLRAGLTPAQYLALTRNSTLLTWLFVCLEVSQSLTSSKQAFCSFEPVAVILSLFTLYDGPINFKEGVQVYLLGFRVNARLTLPDSTCFFVTMVSDDFLPYCVTDMLPPFCDLPFALCRCRLGL